jgi:hypothetical protein
MQWLQRVSFLHSNAAICCGLVATASRLTHHPQHFKTHAHTHTHTRAPTTRSLAPEKKAISAAVLDLKPADVAIAVVPLLRGLLRDPYADVRAAALRQVASVGESSDGREV